MLDPCTKSTIRENVLKVPNREQRCAIKNPFFSIPEFERALDRLKKGVVPGVNRLPAEAYQRLTLPVQRRLAACLWDIVTGITPIPPEWSDLVHPLHKKGDLAQPGNWRPIVCATTEVKLVWTLILGRIAPAVFAHMPASIWGAMVCRSPPEALFLQDTAVDLMTGYMQTWLYAVITATAVTTWTGTDSGVPQGGAQGPFLYLLVTLALAFELAREYPGYAPYPLRSPLKNFAENNLLTTATRHRDRGNTGLPTISDQTSAILSLTTTYLDAQHLLVNPRNLVALADVRTPAVNIRKGEPLHLEDTRVHIGVTHSTRHNNIALPVKLEGGLAQLPQLAREHLLSIRD